MKRRSFFATIAAALGVAKAKWRPSDATAANPVFWMDTSGNLWEMHGNEAKKIGFIGTEA